MRTAFMAFVLTLYLFTNVAAHDAKRELANQSFKNVSGVVLDGGDFIRTPLENQGFQIVATIDHQAGARSVDLELRPTQVIIFNLPQFDKALIVRKHIAALDHLHKFLALEDENGDIQLRFNPPGFLIDGTKFPSAIV